MNLTPREKDKLLIAMAAMVARRRLERGVKLNHPEAIALISDFILEGARDGRTVAELMEKGAHVISRGAGDGRHRRNDPGDSGGSHVSGRHQARHRARADTMNFSVIPGATKWEPGIYTAQFDPGSSLARPRNDETTGRKP